MHREIIWSPLAEKDLGNILVRGVNTSSAEDSAAQILFEVGAAGADTDAVSGRMSFYTSDLVGPKESFRIDDSQNVLIANNNGLVIGAQAQESIGGVTAELQVLGTGYSDSAISLGRWSNDAVE